ncbi:MAG: hypothetical protein WC107_07350 [Patescibacteria group bacterium]
MNKAADEAIKAEVDAVITDMKAYDGGLYDDEETKVTDELIEYIEKKAERRAMRRAAERKT